MSGDILSKVATERTQKWREDTSASAAWELQFREPVECVSRACPNPASWRIWWDCGCVYPYCDKCKTSWEKAGYARCGETHYVTTLYVKAERL